MCAFGVRSTSCELLQNHQYSRRQFAAMNFFHRAPFVRLLLPFLIGIVCAIYWDSPTMIGFYFTVAAFLILVGLLLLKPVVTGFKLRWVFGTILAICLFLIGFQLTNTHTDKHHPRHFSKLLDGPGLIVGEVAEQPQAKTKTIKIILKVLAIRDLDEWVTSHGQAIVYFELDSLSSAIRAGDRILVEPAFKEVAAPQNPAEFDYRKYLSFHLVYEQAYIKSSYWVNLETQRTFALLDEAADVRTALIGLLSRQLDGDQLDVASALVLGYKDKLDAELKRSYSNAGAMHVLAVSGLHVGIIFLVFTQMLSFLGRWKAARYIRAALLVGLLWSYALLTGMSPSVMRAATMFTFIIVGQSLERQPNIYNSIAASAFVMLLINPFLIMDVGFQLSYLAVIGIVYMQPRIYKSIYLRFWLLDKMWALVAVSLAAQIATFPISLYYFHQFPNYFLLSNFLVIPAATLILYLGLLLFVISPIDTASEFIGWLLSWCIRGLNVGVEWIEQLPYSVTSGISISLTECILIYFSIVSMLYFLQKRRPLAMQLGFTSLIVFTAFQSAEAFQHSDQKKFIVYNIRKTSAYNFIDGSDNILFCSLKRENHKQALEYHVQNHWFDLGLKGEKYLELGKLGQRFKLSNLYKISNLNLFLKQHFLQFYDVRILVVNKQFELSDTDRPLALDYIIVADNVKISVAKLAEVFTFQTLIIDGSNSNYRMEQWQAESEELGIEVHAVAQDGAFLLDL